MYLHHIKIKPIKCYWSGNDYFISFIIVPFWKRNSIICYCYLLLCL